MSTGTESGSALRAVDKNSATFRKAFELTMAFNIQMTSNEDGTQLSNWHTGACRKQIQGEEF